MFHRAINSTSVSYNEIYLKVSTNPVSTNIYCYLNFIIAIQGLKRAHSECLIVTLFFRGAEEELGYFALGPILLGPHKFNDKLLTF